MLNEKIRSGWLPFALQTFLSAFSMLVAWCALDWYAVTRSDYPENVHDGDFLLILLPLLGMGAIFISNRAFHLRQAPATLIAITLASIPLAFALILYLGISFHLWIGGTL